MATSRGGRRSEAALSVAASNVATLKTAPVSPFKRGERADAIWRNVVGSVQVDYFSEGDMPLLRAYCQASAQLEAISGECDKLVTAGTFLVAGQGAPAAHPYFKIQDTLARQVASLAVKLRLAASTRYDTKKAAGLARKAAAGEAAAARKPWQ